MQAAPGLTAPACLVTNTIDSPCTTVTTATWSGLVCRVDVKRTAEGIQVTPYTLRVPPAPLPSMPPRPVRIVWTLSSPGDSFGSGDGADVGSNAEFDQGAATSDSDGDTPAANATHHRLRFLNTVASKSHHYTMRITTAGGAHVACDPTITNRGN